MSAKSKKRPTLASDLTDAQVRKMLLSSDDVEPARSSERLVEEDPARAKEDYDETRKYKGMRGMYNADYTASMDRRFGQQKATKKRQPPRRSTGRSR